MVPQFTGGKPFNYHLNLHHTNLDLNDDIKKKKKPNLENIVGKGENAAFQHFLLFPQCLIPFSAIFSIKPKFQFYRLQMLSISKNTKILSSGKGLIDSWPIV